jgi:hypothetical protein
MSGASFYQIDWLLPAIEDRAMSARLWFAAAVVALLAPTRACAADPADAIANLIDRHLTADWAAHGITPATPADEGEWLRRVHLDLIGRAPRVAETRAFLDDPRPTAEKRKALVEKLLAMPAHAQHFAAVTRAAWLPQTLTNFQFANAGVQFQNWLRVQFQENTPADEVVRRLLTVPFTVNNLNPQFRFVQAANNDPESQTLVGFYQANEARAENLGSAVSRLFVGVKLECAQCHDHPFAPYTREQFWEFAAFFAELNLHSQPPPGFVGPIQPHGLSNQLRIPNTEKTVVARFFDGSEPVWSDNRSPREELARWLTHSENPYFAQNLANRMWAHFFGIGIVDPVDEPGENNPPSHPELLAELGKAFAAARFDNRVLIRAITRSQAYQLSSKLTHPTQTDSRRFARMNIKGLTPAQLFDSFVAATGHREPAYMRTNQFNLTPQPNNPRSQFFARFFANDKPTEASTTILQALMLMNGQFISDQTSLEKSEVLAAIVDVPGWNTQQRITALFLTAFARTPRPEELERFTSYVDRGGATGNPKKALADVFWVLLNSPEFLFNH